MSGVWEIPEMGDGEDIDLVDWCPEGDLNPHDRLRSADFKSAVSADFTIRAATVIALSSCYSSRRIAVDGGPRWREKARGLIAVSMLSDKTFALADMDIPVGCEVREAIDRL